MLQREQIGSWKERQDLERELNGWLRQFVADQENPPAEVRSRCPLRSAHISVLDVEGEPGWYQVALSVRPHFKYMGASFELSLVGRLDKIVSAISALSRNRGDAASSGEGVVIMSSLLSWDRDDAASLFDRIRGGVCSPS